MSLRIRTVSPEPLLFARMKYGCRRRVQPKFRHLAHWMAAHARLKNEFTEDVFHFSLQGYSSGSDLSEGELEKQRRLLLQQLEEQH